eukprot:TRINITY_DN60457_c0_g1_i1.p1 TRINITY_DN60457_c0_g1~~TRINITY_DN60457_c0_g1_i1.p1  ORF type:complete len:169 (+),score=25.65 TRINITY_DN60457_c0_g1_i1:224-730(+)
MPFEPSGNAGVPARRSALPASSYTRTKRRAGCLLLSCVVAWQATASGCRALFVAPRAATLATWRAGEDRLSGVARHAVGDRENEPQPTSQEIKTKSITLAVLFALAWSAYFLVGGLQIFGLPLGPFLALGGVLVVTNWSLNSTTGAGVDQRTGKKVDWLGDFLDRMQR